MFRWHEVHAIPRHDKTFPPYRGHDCGRRPSRRHNWAADLRLLGAQVDRSLTGRFGRVMRGESVLWRGSSGWCPDEGERPIVVANGNLELGSDLLKLIRLVCGDSNGTLVQYSFRE